MTDKKSISKKTIILYVLNVLRKYATREEPISQTALALVLTKAGVPCDRKTVGRNIEYLIAFGYPIKKLHGKGYYLDREQLELIKSEKFLIV